MRKSQISRVVGGVLTFVVSMGVLLPGCVVRVPQLDALVGSVKDWVATEPSIRLSEFRWTARLGNEGRLLTLYELEDQFVFASDDGEDLLLFDGWVMRRVQGFALKNRIDIKDTDLRRGYRSGDTRLEVLCQPFESVKRVSYQGILRVQYCSLDGKNKPNIAITLDVSGDIVVIKQALGVEDLSVELRRVKRNLRMD